MTHETQLAKGHNGVSMQLIMASMVMTYIHLGAMPIHSVGILHQNIFSLAVFTKASIHIRKHRIFFWVSRRNQILSLKSEIHPFHQNHVFRLNLTTLPCTRVNTILNINHPTYCQMILRKRNL